MITAITVVARKKITVRIPTQPASAMLNEVLAAVPNIFAGALVLIVAYVVAKIVSGLVSALLAGVGFDAVPAKLGLGQPGVAGGKNLSDMVGVLLLTAIMLFAVIEALSLIGFTSLASLVATFLVFASRVLFGVVVIGLGMFLAKIVANAIKSANPPNAVLLAGIARAAILVLAFAMGLEQMDVGEDIISLAFGLSLGAIAVAAAISFGFGGREVAAELVAGWSKKLPSSGAKAPEKSDD